MHYNFSHKGTNQIRFRSCCWKSLCIIKTLIVEVPIRHEALGPLKRSPLCLLRSSSASELKNNREFLMDTFSSYSLFCAFVLNLTNALTIFLTKARIK